MSATIDAPAVGALPLAPKNPLPLRRLLSTRQLHTGLVLLSQVGGPVSRIAVVPKAVAPPIVLVTSPSGIRDVLGRTDSLAERCTIHEEVRNVVGDNLFVLPNSSWPPRRRALQPVFTKQNVDRFGGHMTQAAQTIADQWRDVRDVDLDAECRRLAMRSLGYSILGLDINEHANTIAESMHVASRYTADRALRPLRAPHWLPTPGRRRARAAVARMRQMTMDVLQECRANPKRDAPLVKALLAATDPDTGRSLSDDDMCNDLLIFMLAGHDTTATTLTYALWQLGHNPDMQDRVAAEVAAIGDRELTPDDVSRLGYTAQVLNESLRLCPPAAGVGRTAMQDIAVDGYRVEAGSVVAIGISAVHQDPTLWDHPLAFNPDRFSPENSKTRDRWQFIPFAAGPRSCIGEHFAMLVTTLALATIVRSNRIQSLNEDFPIESPYTTIAKGPIPVRVDARV
ncbi:cytochrome P450 [Mycobacterium sp. CBMA293]|uniref:cytochrome P450 n=1 Tax=unclassified Mycolicibacterium TaxID=2636767 RepID=UPI0012DDC18A|nr:MULTISPECIES: cytochrome P450 [unclassified Mycolicibacterium]MUL48762.1 cytochrome P450 [Mycolicibacterium sp. CBMA 360]MUL62217.1 cytochrome P450 [Mycolicibacterium sp. CBMA 335]MUL71678.1 cytochrome P450 [Mycolicibacterium sp. CBMA 311]MUL93633.1 cytochrome P450 [Mycolicibacterium sp. CBMA 230]MUM09315.1 cytochrome P450 [Mycolicibacterium sp. CBMA 213]